MRLPVFLGRRPAEPVDEDLRAFHLRLVAAAAQVRHGDWQRCEASGWPDDQSCDQLVAWCWSDDEHRSLVVVNLADAPAAAQVHLPWADLAGRTWRLEDLLSGDRFERDGDDDRHRRPLRRPPALGSPRPALVALPRGGMSELGTAPRLAFSEPGVLMRRFRRHHRRCRSEPSRPKR